MGAKHTKTKKNKTFKEIGEKANKGSNLNHANTLAAVNSINLTNTISNKEKKSHLL